MDVISKAGDMNEKALKQTLTPFAKFKADEVKGGAQVSTVVQEVSA